MDGHELGGVLAAEGAREGTWKSPSPWGTWEGCRRRSWRWPDSWSSESVTETSSELIVMPEKYLNFFFQILFLFSIRFMFDKNINLLFHQTIFGRR